MLIVLLSVFKMYLALTATYSEHRAFLVESATREEQQGVNRGQRELERIEGAMQKTKDQEDSLVDVSQYNTMNDGVLA